MAETLFLNVRTVQGQMSDTLAKLGVSSRTEAVMQALNELL